MASIQTAPCCSACGSNAPAAPPRNLLPAFVLTALAFSVALGVSTGGWAIWQMAFATGTVLQSHLQLHAHVQLLGFAGLFILGIALHALPRILGAAPPSRRVLFTVLAGVGGGALLRAFGQPLAPWPAGRFLSLLSGAFELAGVFAFLGWVLPVLAVRRPFGDPLSLHVLLGSLWAASPRVGSSRRSPKLLEVSPCALRSLFSGSSRRSPSPPRSASFPGPRSTGSCGTAHGTSTQSGFSRFSSSA